MESQLSDGASVLVGLFHFTVMAFIVTAAAVHCRRKYRQWQVVADELDFVFDLVTSDG